MKSPLKTGLNLLALGLISTGIYHANKVEAINTIDDGWRTEAAFEIDTLEWCVSIVNPTGHIIYVPTRSWTEWNNFKAAAPSKWISLGACASSGGGGGGGGGLGDSGGGGSSGGDSCGADSGGGSCDGGK